MEDEDIVIYEKLKFRKKITDDSFLINTCRLCFAYEIAPLCLALTRYCGSSNCYLELVQ